MTLATTSDHDDHACPSCGARLLWWGYSPDDLGTHWVRLGLTYERTLALISGLPVIGACPECDTTVALQ